MSFPVIISAGGRARVELLPEHGDLIFDSKSQLIQWQELMMMAIHQGCRFLPDLSEDFNLIVSEALSLGSKVMVQLGIGWKGFAKVQSEPIPYDARGTGPFLCPMRWLSGAPVWETPDEPTYVGPPDA